MQTPVAKLMIRSTSLWACVNASSWVLGNLSLRQFRLLGLSRLVISVQTHSHYKLYSAILAQYPAGVLAGFDAFLKFIDSIESQIIED